MNYVMQQILIVEQDILKRGFIYQPLSRRKLSSLIIRGKSITDIVSIALDKAAGFKC